MEAEATASTRQAIEGNGRSCDEALNQRRRELARVTKERDFLREAAAFLRERQREFRMIHNTTTRFPSD